ncbi:MULTISPECIES: tetratricopeptide repeat-containing protein [unclassified Moorena]|uniref:tetratricopeptide repeat-containing protein n=1 Tax=unclassified Moorena TaxID=2683338 RepID=UPI0025CBC79A|nr:MULTISPECIES: tetratricopeptide repeat-containing protein [unclassified Moorena]
MLQEAIAILQQAGFDLTAREIAEIFWLAVHLDQPIDESEEPQPQLQASTVSQEELQQPPNPTPDISEESSPEDTEPPAEVDLASSKPKKTKESGEAIPIKVPAAVALRNTLALGRALRPLMRKVPSAIETILDEEATVYQIAESNIWLPVLKPASERWLELALVVEKTSSTAVWKQTIIELQHLVKHHGAFRDVRTWELTITETEEINKPKVDLFPQTSTGGYDSTPYPPQVLIDPKKQRLILLISDCISVAWRRQLIHPVLELWGRNGLLTILQLLPERLWERTALGSETPVQLHSLSPGVVNSQLIVKSWDEDDIELFSEVENREEETGNSSQNKSSINVPVVTLEPYPLLAWSQVIAGQGNVTTVGFKFYVSENSQAERRELDGKPSQPQLTAEALVSRFRATASPMARRLAGLMAAAPVSLPVVQLIQQTLLPKSAQIHVAEVFMSGLLQSITPVDQDSNPDYIEYEFKPGLKELLVDSVPISKTLSVLDTVSEFVADHLGLSVKDFEARLLTPATASNDGLEEKIRPFAHLKAQVLGRLGGEYARLAEQLLKNEELVEDTNSTEDANSEDNRTAPSISEIPTPDHPSSQDYLQFLEQVLQATVDSKGNPKVVYPLLEANLNKLDDNFLDILQTWASDRFSELEPETTEAIARVIGEFSSLIRDFPLGNKASNMEIAIAGYQTIITVFTRESKSETWATIQNNLGNAYRDRIRGERALNLEKAIAQYQLALSVYTKQNFPIQWAGTQNNLGNAYRDRIRGERALNLERAIEAYQLALSVRTKSDFPYHWAQTQNNLGLAYRNRIRDDRALNLELAIEAYQRALSVYTKSNFPYDWAQTQNNLGIAYRNRIRSDRALNLERAIEAYQLALSVYTKSDFPIDWARTQNNLGIAYRNRIRDNRALNLELAIEAYQLALSVYTKSDFPIDWARTQNNLGNAYLYRIYQDRADNLENAIAAYQQALTVRTKSDFPINWAVTQNNLGIAYRYRIRGDRQENLKQAIVAYQLALEVHTKEANPIECLRTSRNLRHLHFKQGNWQTAIDAYQQAIAALQLSRSWAMNDQRRQEIMAEAIAVYQKLVQAYINIEQSDKAIETVERSKDRNLVELLTNRDLYPKGNVPQEIITELDRLRREIPW